MPNRLADETSPYLLQHADNPVDWWPWSTEAFAEAERRGVPVLLSVGYAACHWCHVMAHESFESPAVAALMNELYVNVKVDREERPDVDAVYMEVTQAMTGHGGWPMTVFLTPAGEPFYCGTYYPPDDRHGMPGFPRVLQAVAAAWTERREELTASAQDVVRRIGERSAPVTPAPVTAEMLDGAAASLRATYDPDAGGFGGAPKFPPSMCLEFLLRHHARTKDATSLAMVEHTCERMARGGMYDQLAGGFARYAVDGQWVVPHFEKMLYDNALLLRTYLHLWRSTGSSLARRVADETATFLVRDLGTAEGGFASALDADSEGEEGKYYVWTPEQLNAAVGPDDGAWAADVWSVGPAGTFEHGSSVLQRLGEPDDLDRYDRVRARLLAARATRVPPARDDKVVTAWNGMAIAALAEAGVLLDRSDLVDAAVRAAELLYDVHWVDDRLRRVSRNGRVGRHLAVLEDYGCLADGLFVLAAVTGNPVWGGWAMGLVDATGELFRGPSGEVYDSGADAEALVRRPYDPTDNATPAGSSVLAAGQLTYAAVTGQSWRYDDVALLLGQVAPIIERHARFAGYIASVGEAYLAGPAEVAVVGPYGDAATLALVRGALSACAPGVVIVRGHPDSTPSVPLLEGRGLVDGQPAAYVCRQFVCAAPVTDPGELGKALDGD